MAHTRKGTKSGGAYGKLLNHSHSDLHIFIDGQRVLAISPGGDTHFVDDPDTLVATMRAIKAARAKLIRLGVPDV
jgi:hypothetical protein